MSQLSFTVANATDAAQEMRSLLEVLPSRIQDVVEVFQDQVEDIYLDEGELLDLRLRGDLWPDTFEHLVTMDDLKYVSRRVGGFKDNGRAGIRGRLHRVSRKQDDLERLCGITIRVGRHLYGVAEPLRSYLTDSGSMLVIGSPGKGKTTLIRDMVRISAETYRKQTCVCDTSGEIGGHGRQAHPCIGQARRFHVPNPSVQARILMQIIQNHTPRVIYLDEMGYYEDVEIAERAARSGTKIVGTVHGEIIDDVLENPILYPLLGHPDKAKGRRLYRPTFQMALEVVDKGIYRVFPNLAAAVDALLIGEKPPSTLIEAHRA